MNKKTKCIEARLNHVYDNKTIISTIYQDWIKTIDTFAARAKKKGISAKHIIILTDTLDDNNEKVIKCLFSEGVGEGEEENGYNFDNGSSKGVNALELVKEKIAELFLDEVKTPYAAIKVEDHIETIAIGCKGFEDWIGATYYYYRKSSNGANNNNSPSPYILPKEEIAKIQSVLRYEANSSKIVDGSKRQVNVKTLYLRIAAFVDSEAVNPDDNKIFYDLCNPDWEIVKITRYGWSIEKNYPEILFKRYPIMNSQVYPRKDYPSDILEQFLRLTNVYDDEDNRLLAIVYVVALFLLSDLPKPMLNPNGPHASGKSTYQEFVKLIVDPSGLYTNDEDVIYNMKRAVGYNGINVSTHKADLLDRLLNLRLKHIEKRKRKKLKQLQKEFGRILPYLLGYIFDVLVKVLNRVGEVKLDELPRMADFAEMGELVARCLGYPEGRFTEAYNRNIGYTNEEVIDANLVATAIRILMSKQRVCTGKAGELLAKFNDLASKNNEIRNIVNSKWWPLTPRAFSNRITEVEPNLKEVGIIIERKEDKHSKSDILIITNENYCASESSGTNEEDDEIE